MIFDRKKNLYSMLQAGIFLFTLLFFSLNLYEAKVNIVFNFCAWFSILNLLLIIIVNKKSDIEILSPSTILIILAFLYNCGQVWLLLFGTNLKETSFTIDRYTNEAILKSLFFFLVIINGINLFVLVYNSKLINRYYKKEVVNHKGVSKEHKKYVFYTGIIIFIITAIALLYNDFQQIKIALISGISSYTDAFTFGRNNTFVYYSIYLYPASVFMVLYGAEKKAPKLLVSFHALIRCFFMMFIVGSRTSYIPLLVCLFLYYVHNSKRKINYLKIFFIIMSLVLIYTTISATRNLENKMSFTTLTQYITDNNIFVDLLQEMGGTQVDTIILVNNCPQILPFAFGKSYLGQVIDLIPLITNPYGYFIDLGNICNGYFFKGMSLGGNFIAEIYYNFYIYGILVTPILGILIAKLNYIVVRKNTFQSAFKQSMILYIFYMSMIAVRTQAYDMFLCFKILLIVYMLKLCVASIFRYRIRPERINDRRYEWIKLH